MVRPDLEDIPDYRLPGGLQVRSVKSEDHRAIWDADVEAFRDHWGYSPPTGEDYDQWLNDKIVFTPELWKIVWDVEKNEIAGQVRGFINHEENKAFNQAWLVRVHQRAPTVAQARRGPRPHRPHSA
jgi:hypothetical protein